MRVKVVSANCTLGAPGDVVTIPDGVNSRALIRAGVVTAAPKPVKKTAAKKATST